MQQRTLNHTLTGDLEQPADLAVASYPTIRLGRSTLINRDTVRACVHAIPLLRPDHVYDTVCPLRAHGYRDLCGPRFAGSTRSDHFTNLTKASAA